MITKRHLRDGIPFLINGDIIEKLNNDTTPYRENPAIPFVGKGDLCYLETAAVKRYESLVEQFQNTVGVQNIVPMHVMVNSFQSVIMVDQIETPHRAKLAEMAVRYVKEDFNLLDDEILFDAEIVGFGNVKLPSEMKFEPKPNDASAKMKYEMTDELHKRRFINALTAGASKKGHYIFHLAEAELRALSDSLVDLYQLLMISNDLTYYLLDDNMAKSAMSSDSDEQNAGTMQIKWSPDGTPIIYARAVNFPTLIHELIKGVMEIISYIAFPNGKDEQQYVIDESDHVLGEMWDLRLGPSFWESFYGTLTPEEITNKKMVLSEIYKKDTADFLAYFRNLLQTELEK